MSMMRTTLLAGAAFFAMSALSSQAYAVTAVCTNTQLEINTAKTEINFRIDAMSKALDSAIRTVGRATAEKFDQLAKYEEEIAKNSDKNAAELRKQQNVAEATRAMQMPIQGCRTATIGASMGAISARSAAVAKQTNALNNCWNRGCPNYPTELGPIAAAGGLNKWNETLQASFTPEEPASGIYGRSFTKTTFTEKEVEAAQMSMQLMGNAMPIKKPNLDPNDANYATAKVEWEAIQSSVEVAQAAMKEELAIKSPNEAKMKELAQIVFANANVTIPEKPSELTILELEANRRWGNKEWHEISTGDSPEAVMKDLRDIMAFSAHLQMRQYKKQLEMDKRVGGIMLEMIKINAKDKQQNINSIAP